MNLHGLVTCRILAGPDGHWFNSTTGEIGPWEMKASSPTLEDPLNMIKLHNALKEKP